MSQVVRIIMYSILIVASGVAAIFLGYHLGFEVGHQMEYEKSATAAKEQIAINKKLEKEIISAADRLKIVKPDAPSGALLFYSVSGIQKKDPMLYQRDNFWNEEGGKYMRAERYFNYDDYREADVDPDKPPTMKEMLKR